MFKILDGRDKFYQWDVDRQLIVEDAAITEVHFCNRTDNCSLVCETFKENGLTLVNVPNILLQTDWKIRVYAYDGKHTKHDECYEVKSRTKPADYVYTETEIKNWEALEREVEDLIFKGEHLLGGCQTEIREMHYLNQEIQGKLSAGEFDGEDGKSAYQIALDNGFIGTEEDWLTSLKGNTDTDLATINELPTLGAELATATGWTTTGWTGDFATGFKHTSGNTSPLSFNIPGIAENKSYVIAFKCSVAFTDKNILVTIGEAPASPIYGIANDNVIQWGVRAIDTGALTFTPESSFVGTISEISIKEITDVSMPYMNVYDTDEKAVIEYRTNKRDLDNIFIGKNVGGKNVSGFDNYAIGGDNTFQNNISGFWNVAIGQQTLQNNVSGSRNVSIGRSNLLSNISGTRNVCIGTYVLTKAKNPNHNVCIGADVMNLATGGELNVAIGFQAMYNNTEGSRNVAIGSGAGASNSTGKNNVFIGDASASKNTTGSNNACMGTGALQLNETGNSNVAIGSSALYKGTAPKENVAIGVGALQGTNSTVSGGTRNVALGYGALKNETSVHNTIAIGYNTGTSLTTGRENIIIGTSCDLPAGSTYKLNIGNLLKGDLTAGSAYLDVNGGLQLKNIPTSDPGIAGRVWNDNGTLKVSMGA